MPTIEEAFTSRQENIEDDSPRSELTYIVRGAADEWAVRATAETGIPTRHGDLHRLAIIIQERLSPDSWSVVARYGPKDFDEDDPQPVISFDTSGGSQHITQSIDTRGSYGENPPDFGGAIGFDGQQVQGIDISVPVFNFQETHFIPESQVDSAYMGILFRTTGSVNSDTFKGFDPGECLFLGASGSNRGDGFWEITFRFGALPNKTNLQVGNITVDEKRGWDYLWVRYADGVDDAAKAIIPEPVAAYVEQVYPEKPFAGLGLN